MNNIIRYNVVVIIGGCLGDGQLSCLRLLSLVGRLKGVKRANWPLIKAETPWMLLPATPTTTLQYKLNYMEECLSKSINGDLGNPILAMELLGEDDICSC